MTTVLLLGLMLRFRTPRTGLDATSASRPANTHQPNSKARAAACRLRVFPALSGREKALAAG